MTEGRPLSRAHAIDVFRELRELVSARHPLQSKRIAQHLLKEVR